MKEKKERKNRYQTVKNPRCMAHNNLLNVQDAYRESQPSSRLDLPTEYPSMFLWSSLKVGDSVQMVTPSFSLTNKTDKPTFGLNV